MTNQSDSSTASRLRFSTIFWELKRSFVNPRRLDFGCSAPLITGDDFRASCHFVFDDHGLTFLPSQVFPNALVFIKAYPPLIDYFFQQIHPRIRHPYRLLTHNEDRSMPGQHAVLLDDPKLLHWYSTNISCPHPKLTSIPIGILNQRAGGDSNTDLLKSMGELSFDKQPLAYMNFHIGGETERPGYRRDRQSVHDLLCGQPWVHAASRVSSRQYLHDIASHKFIISPPGHGPDCFRHWEAMYLGSIPVVQRCVNMDCYADFPMILVDDWSQVTLEFLLKKSKELSARPFDRSRLFFAHWKEQLSPCR